MLPDCRGVVGVSSESSLGASGGAVFFRLRDIRFWRAAASTAFPFTSSLEGVVDDTGLLGRLKVVIDGIIRFGVETPVFVPVAVPSFLGNCTLRVSKYSSVTHSSKRLLTEMKQC